MKNFRYLLATLLIGTSLVSVQDAAVAQDQSPGFLIEGRQIFGFPKLSSAPTNVAPLTGRIILNGQVVDYGTKLTVDAGAEGATNKDRLGFGNLTYTIRENLTEQFVGQLYVRTQESWHFQLGSIDTRREVRIDSTLGGTLTGFKLQFTATGECLAGTANEGGQCSFTPGLRTAGNDPDTLVPNSFAAGVAFGETVDPVTLAALKQPGFQRGTDTEGAPEVGIDLDVRNAGFVKDEGSGFNQILRADRVDRAYVPVVSKVRQEITSNDTQASLSRDIKSFALLPRDQWTRANVIANLLGWAVLPSMGSRLTAGSAEPRLNLSNNLFNAMNNARVPANSYTIFSTGRATLTHSVTPPTRATETPVARHVGFWMGLSPVRSSSIVTEGKKTYRTIGPRESVNGYKFSEGGGLQANDIVTGGVTGFDTLTGQFFDYPFTSVADLYTQLGLDVTTQEAVESASVSESFDFDYVPHMSFSANRTAGTTVVRWYLGALLSDETRYYFGTDATLNAENGWAGYARADYYNASDADYYSFAEARLSKKVGLAEGKSLLFGVAGSAKLGKELDLIAKDQIGDQISKLDLFGVYAGAKTEYSLRQRQNGVLGGAASSSTTLGLLYRIDDSFAVSVQTTPVSDESSYIEALASLSWQASDRPGSPTFKAQIAKIRYRLTESTYADPSEINFSLGFGVRF